MSPASSAVTRRVAVRTITRLAYSCRVGSTVTSPIAFLFAAVIANGAAIVPGSYIRKISS